MFDTWLEAIESFNDMLDESGPVQIVGLEYFNSRILREIDPVAYRCELHNYIDACGVDSDDLEGDLLWELS